MNVRHAGRRIDLDRGCLMHVGAFVLTGWGSQSSKDAGQAKALGRDFPE